VDPVGRDPADGSSHILGPVVDDVVGTRPARQLGLGRAAHRGDHLGPGPAGQLDGRVPHGPRPAGDQNGPPGQRAGVQPLRTALGHGEAAVRGQRRDPEARPEVE
jgi:hypothetical protein